MHNIVKRREDLLLDSCEMLKTTGYYTGLQEGQLVESERELEGGIGETGAWLSSRQL